MRSRIFYTLTIALIGGLIACGGKQTPEDSDDEVIGKPPSETDDPFVIMRMPEDALRAETSGYIGPEEGEGASETEEEAVRASKAEPPENEKKSHEPPPDEKGIQCFSCVRICPLSEGADGVDCGEKERDVICGWGVHSDEASARELATAECNGALDMARRMKTWSRIEGECPAPTCR